MQKYVVFLRLLLKHELKLKPFQQILEKVIQTYLLEVEMRKKYNTIVCKRYRDFRDSGRSLNFGWEEIEVESKPVELETLPKMSKPISLRKTSD